MAFSILRNKEIKDTRKKEIRIERQCKKEVLRY